MDKDFFRKNHCIVCGTQACYGIESLEQDSDCKVWDNLRKYPNDEYEMRYKRMNHRDSWRKKHWQWFVQRILPF